MPETKSNDAAALTRLAERLALNDLVGFGPGTDMLATAKVGQSKQTRENGGEKPV